MKGKYIITLSMLICGISPDVLCAQLISAERAFGTNGLFSDRAHNNQPKPVDQAIEIEKSRIDSKAIQTMMDSGEYALALERAHDELNHDFGEEKCKQILACSSAILALQKQKIRYTYLSEFDLRDMNEERAERDAKILPSKEEVGKIMDLYDRQKRVLKQFEKQLETTYKDSPLAWKKKNLDLVRKQISELKESRDTFLSYNVVSLYLYEAHRLCYIARGFWNDDEEGIRHAAEVMARGAHKEWLSQSNKYVRWQYRVVLQYLKENCSESEWEQILLDTTLTDSIDDSKPIGIDVWWDMD